MEASFATSAGLGAIGVATLATATKRQRITAAVPFIFAVQQAIEGFQWRTITTGETSQFLAYVFLFFAFLLWPIYIPYAVSRLESRKSNLSKFFIGLGSAVSLYLLWVLGTQNLAVEVVGSSIQYNIAIPFDHFIAFLYVTATCGPLLLSDRSAVRWFGLVIFAAAALSAYVYYENFISVWCYFAALLSALIFFYLRFQNRAVVIRG